MKKSYIGPDNLTQNYSYNAINKIKQIEIDGVGSINYSGYKWLRPERIKLPGSLREDKFDDFLRLTERKSMNVGGEQILDLEYQYNETGNIISKRSAEISTDYDYNELQRLVDVKTDNVSSESYAYDPVGNRLTSSKENTYIYDDDNQLLAVGDTSYSYDENGNTVSQKSSDGISDFEYNIDNRLTKVNKNGVEAKYYYDPFGRRLSKEVDGKRTWFYYSAEGLVAEFDAEGTLTKSYAYKPYSTWSTAPVMMSEADTHYFYHNDHLGAPHKLTNQAGDVVWQAIYDTFGKVEIETEIVDNNFRFPGQYFDKETGLYYNWHRYYDPSVGRYLSADPIGLDGGMNLYAYVGGDPINAVDPKGLATYVCRRPLKGSDKIGRIKFHEYSCVINPKTGKTTCSSNTPTGNPLNSPGRPTTEEDGDVYDPNNCWEVEPDNQCMDDCMEAELSRPDRPRYGWPAKGADCKEFTRDLIEKCRRKCFCMNDYREGLDD